MSIPAKAQLSTWLIHQRAGEEVEGLPARVVTTKVLALFKPNRIASPEAEHIKAMTLLAIQIHANLIVVRRYFLDAKASCVIPIPEAEVTLQFLI